MSSPPEPSLNLSMASVDLPRLELAALVIELGSNTLRLESPCTLRVGQLYLLWGPSGSGKSSFARALLGLGELTSPQTPCQGNIQITDEHGVEHVMWSERRYYPASREEIAYLPQSERLGFVDSLSTLDNMRLFSRLTRDEARREVERLTQRFHLAALPARLASASGGERVRLSAVRGLLRRNQEEAAPPLVIADEPTSGLDPRAAQTMADELIALVRGGKSIVIVISHDPRLFIGELPEHHESSGSESVVQILECDLEDATRQRIKPLGQLRLQAGPPQRKSLARMSHRAVGGLQTVGALILAPIAFAWGLICLRWPRATFRQTFFDTIDPGTHVFSVVGCLLVAGTVAYFILQQTPKPELVEPLLLPEILEATGHTLVRVVLPLCACSLVATKLGAAQAARLSSAVRAGLLDTLALARWRIESYALVPAVLAQILCMSVATVAALVSGVVLAAIVYMVGHEQASLVLTLNLMLTGLGRANTWPLFLVAKVVVSGFLAGTVAALFGHSPATSENDVGQAVHRTLLWSVLCVIACQCAFMIIEFTHR